MKHASLAALYRPQTFAQVAGQEMVTTVLSRAAAEDRVAPAYLLSGTRGVGKTTIARILAKALNCVNAPGPEPCNQCDQCRKITQGSHVDVTEIDGASNNSVDDARALRENIGYAPMEGRYKIFIIDEAHMLSRSAFNALLKTLEEPPPRVVFIFATTEAHKFPITIVSRCQHFIFKRLPEEGLVAHVTRVLKNEGLPYDPAAVLLIARRAAGSVRDSMSLLGQTLALGGQGLTVEATRNVLGLAGQDLFARLLEGLAAQDCIAVTELVRELLDQGVDIGFFLRELTSLWRTLFLLRHAGQAVLPSLGLPEDEATLWLNMAPRFSLAHIHAAWHMVLDAQRKVIHSPEPAAALELLLLNLALMPKLLPLERAGDAPIGGTQVATPAPQIGQAGPAAAPTAPSTPPALAVPATPTVAPTAPVSAAPSAPSAPSTPTGTMQRAAEPVRPEPTMPEPVRPKPTQPAPARASASPAPHVADELSPPPYFEDIPHFDDDMPTEDMPPESYMPLQHEAQNTRTAPTARPAPRQEPHTATNTSQAHVPVEAAAAASAMPAAPTVSAAPIASAAMPAPVPTPTRTAPTAATATTLMPDRAATESGTRASTSQPQWEDFCTYCQEHGKGLVPAHFLRQTQGVFDRGTLRLSTSSTSVCERLDRLLPVLRTMAGDYTGGPVDITLDAPTHTHKTEAMLKEEFAAREELQPCIEILNATLHRVRPIEN